MASVLNSCGFANNPREACPNTPSCVTAADTPLFRFKLRQLLLFVAAVCMLLAGMVSAKGPFALVLLVASVVVAMHVFATALGHQLQLRTERERLHQMPERDEEESTETESVGERTAKIAAMRAASRSPWHDRGGTYLPWLSRLIVGAMLAGGGVGAVLLGTMGHGVSVAGVVVGATSFAVVSGWFAFLAGNFYGVFRHGFRDALAEEQEAGTRPSA